jgi:hypothetical protein
MNNEPHTSDQLIDQRRCGSCRFGTLTRTGLRCDLPAHTPFAVSGRSRCEEHIFRDDDREVAWNGLLSAALERERYYEPA